MWLLNPNEYSLRVHDAERGEPMGMPVLGGDPDEPRITPEQAAYAAAVLDHYAD